MTSLSGIGVWSSELRYADPTEIAEAAGELDSLGYTALWIPDAGGPVFESLDRLLDATSTATIATGVLNVWRHDVSEVTQWWGSLSHVRRDRFMLGVGVSHAPMIGEQWGRPLAVMNDFIDALDAGGVPAAHRCLAALGPNMIELAGRRTSGAHPYLVTPDHTAQTRVALGQSGLYVEQGVVLERDATTARGIARAALETYCRFPNYVNNWKRMGFTDEDIASRSTRLVDGLFAWGDRDSIWERVDAHHAAGADHVCIQVLKAPGQNAPRDAWRALAPSTR